ncbi:MAG TPA: DUF2924 domain-containing protein [Cellvibrionaceae bacterium]|nr:DUF2924 domain-containing protein [Cellvibrionaceae bacterium]
MNPSQPGPIQASTQTPTARQTQIAPPAYITPAPLIRRIVQLPELPITDLKALWLELFGSPPTTHSRPFLVRRIAYQLQENEFRKVNPELLEQNKKRIEALIEQEKIKNLSTKSDSDYALIPGTVLTREYQRVEHCVVVTEDSHFEYQGRRYKSLSVIAREITGTRWSGPLFFGLKIQPKQAVKINAKKQKVKLDASTQTKTPTKTRNRQEESRHE